MRDTLFTVTPVLDLDLGLTDNAGDRAMGSDPDAVARLACAWVEGAREAGMHAVAKHFPGHGSVNQDSHKTLPRDDRTLEEISSRDLVPFKAAIQQGGVKAVMPAHIVFSAVDDQPAGFQRCSSQRAWI